MDKLMKHYKSYGFTVEGIDSEGTVILKDIDSLPKQCPVCKSTEFTKYGHTRLRLYKDIVDEKLIKIGIKRNNYKCSHCNKIIAIENPYLYNKNMAMPLRNLLFNLM